MSRPTILLVSFSPIARDARVLRHLRVLSRLGEVVTVGYGPQPAGAVDHVQVADDLASLPRTPMGVLGLGLRRHKAVELSAPGIAEAARLLRGRRADLVVANDARALPLAFEVAGSAPVWADMHEWAVEEFSDNLTWRLLVAPFAEHLCREFLPRAAAVSTVCDGLAGMYEETYGVRCATVTNAAPFEDLTPSPVQEGRIRLVHSGGAVAGRNLEMLVDAARQLDDRFSLDLFLVPGGDGGRHLADLRKRAEGCARITFRDAVTPAELPHVLNAYDVGIYNIPPVNLNSRYALPNKFFDFIQARLALAIGPAQEMAAIVREHHLGFVADDFTLEAFVASIRGLDAEKVTAAKAATHVAARQLSSEASEAVVTDLVGALLP